MVTQRKTYLQLSEMLGSLLDVHAAEAYTNGTRGDKNDPVTRLPKLDGSVHDQGQDGQQGLMCLFINNGART